MSERDALERRTVTCILPSSFTSASVSMASLRPSSDTTSGSTTMEAMAPAVSGNCSVMRILAPRYSNMNSISVYQMMHWSTTICTMRLPEKSPYMPLSSGMPITSVLGSVDKEKSVMVHSRQPRRER
uniref:Uncharacterized protein n=1 Tax=Zea mays TaxID=4577 RepID=C4J1Q4_MAIZE|nr:unknown [Zea mays]